MKPFYFLPTILPAICISCGPDGGERMKVVRDTGTGQVLVTENGKPVLQYNYSTVFEKDALDTLPANKYKAEPTDTFMKNPSIYAVPRSNYIHPIYGLKGEMLTRDWSKDHPHHRGIYWAWPEVEWGKKRGDLHALQIVFARPTGKLKLDNGKDYAQIEAENTWMWEDKDPIVNETALIRVYPSDGQSRIIDLAFRFVALKDSVTLARRETILYGGFNVRMHTPVDQVITFFTDSTSVGPRRSWSDLSGTFRGAGTTSGMTILQYNGNPDYPGDWIRYPDLSWCQPTFPAAGTRYQLKPGEPLVLRYRLRVHLGDKPSDSEAAELWDTFNSGTADLPGFTFPVKQSPPPKT
jgi:hypothetical protein